MGALIFDAGDLLYYREKSSVELLRDALRRVLGFDVEFSVSDLVLLYDLRELSFRGFISRLEKIEFFTEALGLPRERAEEVSRALDLLYEETLILFPDVPQTLKVLREAGYRLAVLSDSDFTAEEKERWFARAGIKDYFDLVVCSCDIGRCKPEREAYLYVLRKLGVKPYEAVFIGHSPKDIVGAKVAGLKTIALRCPLKGISDAYITKFSEIPRALREVLGDTA